LSFCHIAIGLVFTKRKKIYLKPKCSVFWLKSCFVWPGGGYYLQLTSKSDNHKVSFHSPYPIAGPNFEEFGTSLILYSLINLILNKYVNENCWNFSSADAQISIVYTTEISISCSSIFDFYTVLANCSQVQISLNYIHSEFVLGVKPQLVRVGS
jgi:hypothetical protein